MVFSAVLTGYWGSRERSDLHGMTNETLHKAVTNFQLKYKIRPMFGPFWEICFCRTSPIPASHKPTKL